VHATDGYLPIFLTGSVIFFTQVSESIESSGDFGGFGWKSINNSADLKSE
jgi:hypothetical protein